MRFVTRTFLWSFLPFAILLMGSFWAIQSKVDSAVRDGVHAALRENQTLIARLRAKSDAQNVRLLRVVAENPALKAGFQLLLSDRSSRDARLTVEDQLSEICGPLGFDFLVVSDERGPLAGVQSAQGKLAPMDIASVKIPRRGFFESAGRTYQVTSVPVDQGNESIGILSVGEHFDFAEFGTPAVLVRKGRFVESNMTAVSGREFESALKTCPSAGECELRIQGETFVSMPVDRAQGSSEYILRTLQSVDSMSRPVQAIVQRVFVLASVGALVAALALSVLSSRSVVKPIAQVVSHLSESEKTGMLPFFPSQSANIQEIRDLMESFNQAATAIRDGRENLHNAYVEFAGSLASALDARDAYTAGHSWRVSQYSCAIAELMEFEAQELEELRIGALLHDIGKIGISDTVLQKPGKLTADEFAIIQTHPSIGRRILEGVHGFHPYLPVVELHHENWDGSGYPHRLRGAEVPLSARIVHVADAYDAMTSDRPYRRGMSHEIAMQVLADNAGTQFDPTVVARFAHIAASRGEYPLGRPSESIRRLADAVSAETEAVVVSNEMTKRSA